MEILSRSSKIQKVIFFVFYSELMLANGFLPCRFENIGGKFHHLQTSRPGLRRSLALFWMERMTSKLSTPVNSKSRFLMSCLENVNRKFIGCALHFWFLVNIFLIVSFLLQRNVSNIYQGGKLNLLRSVLVCLRSSFVECCPWACNWIAEITVLILLSLVLTLASNNSFNPSLGNSEI
jgi:hypothetical protein